MGEVRIYYTNPCDADKLSNRRKTTAGLFPTELVAGLRKDLLGVLTKRREKT